MTESMRLDIEIMEMWKNRFEQGAEGVKAALEHLEKAISELRETVDSGSVGTTLEDELMSFVVDLEEAETSLSRKMEIWKINAANFEWTMKHMESEAV